MLRDGGGKSLFLQLLLLFGLPLSVRLLSLAQRLSFLGRATRRSRQLLGHRLVALLNEHVPLRGRNG